MSKENESKYSKPKIMLIDMAEEVQTALLTAGYNIATGTFGTAYKVAPSDGLHVVDRASCNLPNVEEQEIVFASLGFPPPAITQIPEPNDGVEYFWTSGEYGSIDPRPLEMTAHRESLDRILSNGGIFMVFLNARYQHQYFPGANKYGRLGGVQSSGEKMNLSNWAMLSDLDDLRSQNREGFEVTFDSRFGHFSRQIEKAYDGAGFKTEVGPQYNSDKSWESLAVNKFGDSVAGVKTINKNGKTGYLILVPPLPKLHEVVVDLVQDWFALLSPELFPFHDGLK